MNFIFDIDGTICFDGNHIDQSIKIVLCNSTMKTIKLYLHLHVL